ncbi:type II secretion system minor pseudopilin GspK [Geomonas sp. RF6]|uniref:type II secretion system minor pseudopilin GspK n=1 Tax=Geomonas sp. RF6 TaxID=2897342 RepID=UPI001E5E3B62|nr:type II secretion system minor pseudopilin GspK [Geomonas sp. RF6]UFS71600.1 type II secretion system minor pseudopilin GspK [Geomonas sp. RF6]
MKNERGFALVIALMVTALLTALLVEFVSEVYVDTSHSHNFVASQQAGILAASGVPLAVKLLQFDLPTHNGYSSLLDLWAKPISYDAGAGTITVTIEEESGKMNINTATSPNGMSNQYTQMAIRLFKKAGVSPDLTDAVMDWADENDTPSPNGAESSYYRTLKPAYGAKNARLDTVEELALLKGFTPEVLTKLRPLVTVYGESMSGESTTRVNINTAPKEVLAALDENISDSLVENILDFRKKQAIKAENLSSIPGAEKLTPEARMNITYSGSVYRIHAEAKVGESVGVTEAVVRLRSGTQPVFLYWREY